MIIYHNEKLDVHHVITSYPEDYDPKLNDGPFVLHHETMSHRDVHLKRSKKGVITIHRKEEMDLTMVTDQIEMGKSAVIMGIPKGASIKINGKIAGTMIDKTGRLELFPKAPGFYRIGFSLEGHHDEEFALEVVP